MGWRASVIDSGLALRIDHDELFDLLTDNVDLVQGIFSILLRGECPSEAAKRWARAEAASDFRGARQSAARRETREGKPELRSKSSAVAHPVSHAKNSGRRRRRR